MSTSEGDSPSRLDSALTDLFGGSPRPDARRQGPQHPAPASSPTDDWHVDDHDDADDQPMALPTIVPATIDPPAPVTTPAVPSPGAPAAPPTARATGWGDHLSNVPSSAQGAGLRAPGRRPRVRRVTRVLRHIDPWSTFKVALLFSVVAYLVSLTSGVLLWRVADSTGTLDNVERWFTQFGWETFELRGGEIFHNAWIIGLFGAVALTGGLVLLATLFNLVSDIVGGVRMTVLEEEVVERTVSSTRRYVVRRAPVAGDAGTADWDVDDVEGDEAPRTPHRDAPLPTSRMAVTGGDWSVDDDGSGARAESHDAPSAS